MTRTGARRRLQHGAAAVAAAAVVALTLSGCTGPGGESASTGSAGDTDALGSRPAAAERQATSAGTAQTATLLGRELIQRASMTVHARDVGDALVRVRTVVAGVQGVVADEHTRTGRRGDPRRSTLTLRVPVDSFDAVLRDLAGLGRLGTQQVSTEDVSTQVVDVEARIVSAERTLRRIRELLESADDFSDVLSLESELARREADLASLKAQQTYLDDQTSMSTVTLTLLRTTPAAAEPDERTAGFVDGLGVGWAALVGLVTGLLTAVGVLVPLLVLLLPAGLVTWWLLRRLVRRPSPPEPAQPPA